MSLSITYAEFVSIANPMLLKAYEEDPESLRHARGKGTKKLKVFAATMDKLIAAEGVRSLEDADSSHDLHHQVPINDTLSGLDTQHEDAM